jgi:hypothetical protein
MINTDKTVAMERLWKDISDAITTATQLGIPRVTVIAEMLTAASNLRAICEENGDDMSSLQGLLSS